MGRWMKVNDEAIHGTDLWLLAQEGPTAVEEGGFSDGKPRAFTSEDFRFTCRGDQVYCFAMACPENGLLKIRSLRAGGEEHKAPCHSLISRVEVLGLERPVEWNRDAEALTVNLRDYRTDLPLTVRVTVL